MYKTLAELYGAYQAGVMTEVMVLDNDQAAVYDGEGNHIFEMHPEDLLRQALGILNIPYEEA